MEISKSFVLTMEPNLSIKIFIFFFKEHGIIHQTSCEHTPEQNRISERKNRHIIEMTRCLLLQSYVPKKIWSDAVLTSTYLINRLPTPILQNKSPLDILYSKKWKYDTLKYLDALALFIPNELINLIKEQLKPFFSATPLNKKGISVMIPPPTKHMSRAMLFSLKTILTTRINRPITMPQILYQCRYLLHTSTVATKIL
jgi:hypothetical protein